ncbi:MAG: CRISPR-associated protein Cas4 [Methanobrevibacter thaueri]|uniref:CRISPR-associated protein Cas4 n=1 Tax=Methanobrevibacter thaueri TaxID=190975 RepID=UPI0026EA96BA|nr:CRISPR-associated protein Cas4 [Methanobrevibacter thaueri]MBE6495957.1 CRISPR-associated protein Cas4 [Methanobrevibacter thaueri]
MINVSSIKQYMYCPMKLYIQNHVDMSENDNYQLSIEIKKLRIDIQDLIEKNMRKVKKDMTINEIENILSQNIDPYIESTTKAIRSMDLGLESSQINEIIDNAYFNIKITALRTKQAMTILNKNANGIIDMFFPNCMYSYMLKDKGLEMIGICDKIEIIDGIYYPITLKNTNPPLKGVWDQDAIEQAAYAILIEESFKTEVYVGFVNYEKIGEKRPVVMDINLRKDLFDIIREVKEIVENKKLPSVKKSAKKCEKCEYNDICLKN